MMMMVMALSVMAQEGTHNIGITLGFGETDIRERANGDSKKLSELFQLDGITFGLVYETTFVKGLGMQVGLGYRHGTLVGKWKSTNKFNAQMPNFPDVKIREVNIQQRLEMPIDLQYKFEIARYTYLGIYTGPTFQVNVSSSTRYYIKNNTPLNDDVIRQAMAACGLSDVSPKDYFTRLSFDNDNIVDYHRWNITWGVGMVFQYKQFFLRGGYDFGILNPYNDKFYNYTADLGYNRMGRVDQWQIKLGMYFWQR